MSARSPRKPSLLGPPPNIDASPAFAIGTRDLCELVKTEVSFLKACTARLFSLRKIRKLPKTGWRQPVAARLRPILCLRDYPRLRICRILSSGKCSDYEDWNCGNQPLANDGEFARNNLQTQSAAWHGRFRGPSSRYARTTNHNPYRTNNVLKNMQRKTFVSKAALFGCSLIALTGIAGAQTFTDFGPTAPTPGTYDIAQTTTVSTLKNPAGLNYYNNNGNPPGETFTTGSYANGYVLNSVSIKTGSLDWGGGGTSNQVFTLYLYSVSGLQATLIDTYTSSSSASYVPGDWIQWTGLSVALNPSATYGYAFANSGTGWDNMEVDSGNPYAGGRVALFPVGNGAITEGAPASYDAGFEIGLTQNTPQPPSVTADINPTNVTVYANATVTFSAAFSGSAPITYQWQVETNGSWVNITGATNTTLTLATVPVAATGSYKVTAHNNQGNATSSAGLLTVLASLPPPSSSDAFAWAVYTNGPLAYWRLNETGDPTTGNLLAYDSANHGLAGTYLPGVLVDQPGPPFPGFEAANTCADLSDANNSLNGTNNYINIPALNLNTNAVTFIAWINPTEPVLLATGLLFNRNGTDAAGFGFNGNIGPNGNAELGFTWNTNSGDTWGWHSALYPPPSQWSYVAYVITPTQGTVYLGYVDNSVQPAVTNFAKASLVEPMGPEQWSIGGALGADVQESYKRTLNGYLDEAAVFNKSLSDAEIQRLFFVGLGATSLPVGIETQPRSQAVFSGFPVSLNVGASGVPAPAYQWYSATTGTKSFSKVANSSNVSGATSGTLAIANMSSANALDYECVVTNTSGVVTSSVATLSNVQLPANGIWAVNYAFVNSGNGGSIFTCPPLYVGHGVLGTGTYWNQIDDPLNTWTAGTFTNLTSYKDDGVTPTGINVIATMDSGAWTSGPGANNLLSDYCAVGGVGSTITVTNLPNGTYNVAVFGINASYASDATTYTINGVSQSVTNFQDIAFVPYDNSLVFAGVLVTTGALPISAAIAEGTESAFNGLQVQAVSLSPVSISTTWDGTYLTLSWGNNSGYGALLSAPSVTGPWTPVRNAASPFVVTPSPSVPQQFYRVSIP